MTAPTLPDADGLFRELMHHPLCAVASCSATARSTRRPRSSSPRVTSMRARRVPTSRSTTSTCRAARTSSLSVPRARRTWSTSAMCSASAALSTCRGYLPRFTHRL